MMNSGKDYDKKVEDGKRLHRISMAESTALVSQTAVSQPALSHPPVSHPPVSHAPVSHPPVSHPAVSHPALSHAPVSHPPVSHPTVSHPALSHPAVSHPALSHPPVSHPTVSHPALSHPAVSHPAVEQSRPALSHHAMTDHFLPRIESSQSSESNDPTRRTPSPHARTVRDSTFKEFWEQNKLSIFRASGFHLNNTSGRTHSIWMQWKHGLWSPAHCGQQFAVDYPMPQPEVEVKNKKAVGMKIILPEIYKKKRGPMCAACMDYIFEPCFLPCGHSFCRRCLAGLKDYLVSDFADVITDHRSVIKCPIPKCNRSYISCQQFVDGNFRFSKTRPEDKVQLPPDFSSHSPYSEYTKF